MAENIWSNIQHIAYLSVGRVYATCDLRIIFETVACQFSAALSCTLFASITGERYLALYYHLRYHDVVTTRKITIFLVYLFITTGTLSLFRFATKNVVPLLYLRCVALPSFRLLICHWKIDKQKGLDWVYCLVLWAIYFYFLKVL